MTFSIGYAECPAGLACAQVTEATDVGNHTYAINGSYNFCNQQVYSTNGVLLPAATYAQVPETFFAGTLRPALRHVACRMSSCCRAMCAPSTSRLNWRPRHLCGLTLRAMHVQTSRR